MYILLTVRHRDVGFPLLCRVNSRPAPSALNNVGKGYSFGGKAGATTHIAEFPVKTPVSALPEGENAEAAVACHAVKASALAFVHSLISVTDLLFQGPTQLVRSVCH